MRTPCHTLPCCPSCSTWSCSTCRVLALCVDSTAINNYIVSYNRTIRITVAFLLLHVAVAAYALCSQRSLLPLLCVIAHWDRSAGVALYACSFASQDPLSRPASGVRPSRFGFQKDNLDVLFWAHGFQLWISRRNRAWLRVTRLLLVHVHSLVPFASSVSIW